MTLAQFRSLSGDLQRQFVQHSAVFLFGRTAVGVTTKLYQVDGFYVELFFDDRMAEVIHIFSFDDPAKLGPYLQQVDLSELTMLLR